MGPGPMRTFEAQIQESFVKRKGHAVAGDRTRVTRVTGGNTNHYTTTTLFLLCDQ